MCHSTNSSAEGGTRAKLRFHFIWLKLSFFHKTIMLLNYVKNYNMATVWRVRIAFEIFKNLLKSQLVQLQAN